MNILNLLKRRKQIKKQDDRASIKYLILMGKIEKHLSSSGLKLFFEDKHLLEHFDENELGNLIGIAIGDYCYKRNIKLDTPDFVDNIRNGIHHGIDLTTIDGMELENGNLVIRKS